MLSIRYMSISAHSGVCELVNAHARPPSGVSWPDRVGSPDSGPRDRARNLEVLVSDTLVLEARASLLESARVAPDAFDLLCL